MSIVRVVKPFTHRGFHRSEVGLQAVVARHLYDGAVGAGRWNAELVSIALHNEHGNGHCVELG
jgi:hypothetical protein